jgi:hypothetical protein
MHCEWDNMGCSVILEKSMGKPYLIESYDGGYSIYVESTTMFGHTVWTGVLMLDGDIEHTESSTKSGETALEMVLVYLDRIESTED